MKRSLPSVAVLLLFATQARAVNFDVAAFDRERVLKAANAYLSEKPITVTAASSPRSSGGKHDFFSEGDYWWPDPKNPGGPYVRRDGQTNPENFDEHRKAMRRLSVQVPALAAAWKLTKDRKYADHAALHLKAWFADPATMMSPNMNYGQAIHGIHTGRATGVIDTIHLVEVARAIEVLKPSGALTDRDYVEVVRWFKDYLHWMMTHKYGVDERAAKNNHGTCWAAQAAAFAHLTEDEPVMDAIREDFKREKTGLIDQQVNGTGGLPQELMRTKPYSYSLFNLEAFSTIARILSTPKDNLWTFTVGEDSRGLKLAMGFMYPYIKDKKKWPLPADVQYFDQWPMRQSALLFAGLALDKPEYIELWKTLPADSDVDETIRNFFIRQPVLWVD
jgi:hypothetical protein